jgi:hypothetical protein
MIFLAVARLLWRNYAPPVSMIVALDNIHVSADIAAVSSWDEHPVLCLSFRELFVALLSGDIDFNHSRLVRGTSGSQMIDEQPGVEN